MFATIKGLNEDIRRFMGNQCHYEARETERGDFEIYSTAAGEAILNGTLRELCFWWDGYKTATITQ